MLFHWCTTSSNGVEQWLNLLGFTLSRQMSFAYSDCKSNIEHLIIETFNSNFSSARSFPLYAGNFCRIKTLPNPMNHKTLSWQVNLGQAMHLEEWIKGRSWNLRKIIISRYRWGIRPRAQEIKKENKIMENLWLLSCFLNKFEHNFCKTIENFLNFTIL